jgi:uncharacterized protein (DUF3820 family)
MLRHLRLHSSRLRAALLGVLVLGATLVSLSSCSSTTPNRDPLNESFPSVAGEDLNGRERRVSDEFSGKPLIVLVGYVQNAQFDLDRWLIGLNQLATPAPAVELPTIEGLLPGLFAGTIDNGMRSGIPSEDWRGVITLYGEDAERVVALFGNEKPRNGRVALLDAQGRILWFHDRGFSAGKLAELDRLARQELEKAESR